MSSNQYPALDSQAPPGPQAGHGSSSAAPRSEQAKSELPELAAQTSPDRPWPLRLLASKMKVHVERAPETWVTGQIVQLNRRGATQLSFFTLRDSDVDVSMEATAFAGVISQAGPSLEVGSKVVARVKPTYFERSGRLTLRANEIQLQGLGSLLAQIEQLRRRLTAEGLFDEARKKPLPLLPKVIGLVCGKDAKAKDDVLINARLRWPAATFEIREVLVQGPQAAGQVSQAIGELDQIPDVDVIVVARGGGSTEDLLPFSEEVLIRAAASATTPIVSAIGHEADAPLLDFVADFRASTPTDAARRIVPDLADEKAWVSSTEAAMHAALQRTLSNEMQLMHLLLSRPVLQAPTAVIDQELLGVEQAQLRGLTAVRQSLRNQAGEIEALSNVLDALSPAATLERGYAIVRLPGGQVLDSTTELKQKDLVETMLARGTFVSQVVGTNPAGSFIDPAPKEQP